MRYLFKDELGNQCTYVVARNQDEAWSELQHLLLKVSRAKLPVVELKKVFVLHA